ncbi:DNA mismatch repair protein MutS [Bacteroidota bacterium]
MTDTPLMTQYYKIKESHPDSILLFRMGDFFETFDEDAKTISKVLGITLTRRASGKAENVPLAGFPHHAIDSYLPKLVRAGFRVAICEQVENPKFAKGIVKREVIEVVTPGVVFSEKLLDHKKNNYLLSIYLNNDKAGIAFSDVSTGEFYCYEISQEKLEIQLEHINPAELLVSRSQKNVLEPILQSNFSAVRLTRIDNWIFNLEFARDVLLNHFKTKTLKGFGIDHFNNGVIAAGVLLNYLNETQKANLSHINKIALYNPSDYMQLNIVTKRNLEIISTIHEGAREGSLISILDRTETAMGGRLLKKWVLAPLLNVKSILERQTCVEEFYNDKVLRKNINNELKEIGDLERLISKVCTGRVNPREMISIKSSLKKIPLIKQILDRAKSEVLRKINVQLNDMNHLVNKLDTSITEYPPLSIYDGGVICEGYSSELDELRDISKNAKDWIAKLQKKERERTGIPSLKVGYNKVFGYYIDISNTHKSKVPEDFIRKQTLVNSERFITPELKEYEEKVLNAEERISDLEHKLFDEIRNIVARETLPIQNNAKLIAMLDCFAALADCAESYNYSKPQINDSENIYIKQGRHPVVERILPVSEKFIPNDCSISNSENQIIILTGPNMAGKSVYLRQVGLIVLLAQLGSFVPAEEASIGVVDNIFTRVGAHDNIIGGESTFLIEMQEAASILNNATERSLIVLDEIGRGTSTFDGISIAWAITEFIHNNPKVSAKTLFATHYHELNEMASIFDRIKNFKVDVKEYGDKVIFLHRVSPGGADHSYGIQVAQMAGLPLYVTNRAKEILENLESKELTPHDLKEAKLAKIKDGKDKQFNLFEVRDDEIRTEISDIEIDNITPIEALTKLDQLKKKVKKNK